MNRGFTLDDENSREVTLSESIGYGYFQERRVAVAYCKARILNTLGSNSASRFRVNSRNGTSRKRVKGYVGEVEIAVPQYRLGEFELRILPKHGHRFTGFGDKIPSMYARGITTNRRSPTGEIPPSATPQAIPHHHKSKNYSRHHPPR